MRARDAQPVAAELLGAPGSDQEGDVAARRRESGAEIAANGARADHEDF